MKFHITIASIISIARLLCAPVIMILILSNWWQASALLFCLAAISDLLDGAIARFLNQTTLLGEWLDALADKALTILSCLALFITNELPNWFVAIIITRELALMIGACLLYYRHGHFSLKPIATARASMALYISTILMVLIFRCYSLQKGVFYCGLMLLTIVCATVSLVQRYYRSITITV